MLGCVRAAKEEPWPARGMASCYRFSEECIALDIDWGLASAQAIVLTLHRPPHCGLLGCNS